MNVYALVGRQNYDSDSVDGIFSSLDLAELKMKEIIEAARNDRWSRYRADCYIIVEYALDSLDDGKIKTYEDY
jgi:hypothetical protein